MIRYVLIIAALACLLLAFACGDDDEPLPSGSPATFTQSPTPATTPVDQVQCPEDIPGLTLELNGETQPAVPLGGEWAGPDCIVGGSGYPYYYLPADALAAAAGDEPTLRIAEQPDKLFVSAWLPDLSDAVTVGSGETAIPMPPNQPARNSSFSLDVTVEQEQSLSLARLTPGEWAIEATVWWPDGTITFAFLVLVT